MAKILLTGFEAFGTTPVNPAESVARMLDATDVAGAQIVSRIVPNNYFECIEFVKNAMREESPSIVLMLGEAGGRAMVTVERLAQNLNDSTRYRVADNTGRIMQGEFTEPNGPAAYYSNLPIRAMVKAMREAGIPGDISDTAGTFCCNHLMYGILHQINTQQLPVRAGWIHLPHLPVVAAQPDNLGAPSMSAETSCEGVRVALKAAVEHQEDINEPILSRLQ